MNKWIKCSDRLPEIEKKYGYQVWCYYVRYRTDKRTYRICGELIYSKGKFWYNYAGNVEKEVSHWMPLPEPPKK